MLKLKTQVYLKPEVEPHADEVDFRWKIGESIAVFMIGLGLVLSAVAWLIGG